MSPNPTANLVGVHWGQEMKLNRGSRRLSLIPFFNLFLYV